MSRSLITALFLAICSTTSHAQTRHNIQNTNCSTYLLDKFGLSAEYLCVDKDSVYVCSATGPSLGAKLPKSFFKDLAIQKTDLNEVLKASCQKLKEARAPKIGENCEKSDHPLFQVFLDRLGLPVPLHTCFCSSDRTTVLSSCTGSEDNWKATGEFDSVRVQEDLNLICKKKDHKSYKIACFCNKHYSSSLPQYLECLKSQTNIPPQDRQREITPSPQVER